MINIMKSVMGFGNFCYTREDIEKHAPREARADLEDISAMAKVLVRKLTPQLRRALYNRSITELSEYENEIEYVFDQVLLTEVEDVEELLNYVIQAQEVAETFAQAAYFVLTESKRILRNGFYSDSTDFKGDIMSLWLEGFPKYVETYYAQLVAMETGVEELLDLVAVQEYQQYIQGVRYDYYS